MNGEDQSLVKATIRIEHLKFIQAIITRLAGNSFQLKTWTITLVSALFALAAKDSNQYFVLVSYFPIIVFWGLDAYFLDQERMFRKLYAEVAAAPDCDPHFNLKITKFNAHYKGIGEAACSITLRWFYGVMILSPILIMLFLKRP